MSIKNKEKFATPFCSLSIDVSRIFSIVCNNSLYPTSIMKYFLSLICITLCSSIVFAFSPSVTLNLVLQDAIWKLEIIIQEKGEAYRETVVWALENILERKSSFAAWPEKVTYIIWYLINWVQKNGSTLLTRNDFAGSYDGFVIVQLPDQILALVRNNWPLGQNNDDAFEYLSEFIFWNNTTWAEIAMTSPVMRMPLDSSSYETAFIMPSRWTMETLPRPNTDRISFKKNPWSLKAVRRFSWRTSTTVVDAQRLAFQEDLKAAGIARYGLPTLSLYDGPRVSANNRRNELWVDLNPRSN